MTRHEIAYAIILLALAAAALLWRSAARRRHREAHPRTRIDLF